MSKNSSVKYYKKKKCNMLQNDIEISLKKRKTKSRNMVVNDIKILPKMKNKS